MAATITWTIKEMLRTTSDGGVTQVIWECQGIDGTAKAIEGGKYKCSYDASASSFIKYADLKESDVIGWVKSHLNAQDVDNMKVDAIEKRLTDKCAAQLLKISQKSTGFPW
jgi:hypothetical protein